MYVFYLILTIFLLYWFFLIYVNNKANNLVEAIRRYPELYKQAGFPSDTYFFWEFIRLDYRFVIFLYKNRMMPGSLQYDIDEYKSIRNISMIAFFLEILRGISIVFMVIYYQLIL